MYMKPGIYRHYKGQEYRVIAIPKHSETLEDFVLYEALYENPESQLWIRPVKECSESVEIAGQSMSRFEYVRDDE